MDRAKTFEIIVANGKGGVGKSTVTFALGVLLAHRNIAVDLVDRDPQRSLTNYIRKSGAMGLKKERPLVRVTDTAAKGETGSLVDALSATGSRLPDMVIVPTSLNPDDIAQANKTTSVALNRVGEGKVGILFNRVKGGTREADPGILGSVAAAMKCVELGVWTDRRAFAHLQSRGYPAFVKDPRALAEAEATVMLLIAAMGMPFVAPLTPESEASNGTRPIQR